MENAILDMVNYLEDVDFGTIFQGVGIGLLVFWCVVVGWVIVDTRDRFSTMLPRVLSVVVVVLLPLFGLFIYLIVRPRTTIEEEKWIDRERRYLQFETAGLEDCPACGFGLMPNFIFCPRCGKELRKKCVSCEVYLEPAWSVCPFCGSRQSQKEESVIAEEIKKEHIEESGLRGEAGVIEKRERDYAELSVSEPAEKPVPAAAVASPGSVPELRKKTRWSRDARSRQTKSRVSFSERFEKVMLGMDGFVQYVGMLPMRITRKGKSSAVLQHDMPAAHEEKVEDEKGEVSSGGDMSTSSAEPDAGAELDAAVETGDHEEDASDGKTEKSEKAAYDKEDAGEEKKTEGETDEEQKDEESEDDDEEQRKIAEKEVTSDRKRTSKRMKSENDDKEKGNEEKDDKEKEDEDLNSEDTSD